MDLLKLNNIYKSYGNAEVLKDISLEIRNEEFISIVGSSGSGKSTLLYIMGGLEHPTSGSVYFYQDNLNELNDKKRAKIRQKDIGFIFQFYNLVHNLNIEDNIMLPAIMFGKKKKDVKEKLDELLEIVGLVDHRKKIPNQLSGGQQQRVAIARSLINNPQLILADEPTGNLDSASSAVVMELLRSINQKFNTSIVHVTHNPNLIEYGNRILKIKDGEIISNEKCKSI